MSNRDVVQRLRAYEQASPIPRGSTIHHHIAEDSDILIVAFVRMGGEARPWGVAFGHPGDEPTVVTVPEGRNRDLVAAMCARLAPTVLGHLRTPTYVPDDPADWHELSPLRQFWVPNASHLEMLHHMAYAYTFTTWGAGPLARLNPLGRACGWLFRESQRPGQQSVMVATEALRDAFIFPSQESRQGHLGFLLAWLEEGNAEVRSTRASEAERLSTSTSLDPELERRAEPHVDDWNEANRSDDETGRQAAALALHRLLAPELVRRFDLVAQSLETLREDDRPVNPGVAALVDEALKEQWYQHTRTELNLDAPDDGPPFVASPETDRSPAAAGSRYQVHIASSDLRDSVLLHGDSEMQAQAIASGDAFRGSIEAVRDEGIGRASRPVWTVRDPWAGPMRLRSGSRVCVVGMPQRTGIVRALADQPDGSRLVEVEITGWKTTPDSAVAPEHVGRTITFVAASGASISRMKSGRIWDATGPGAWLTHARPGGPRANMPPEVAEDLATTTLEGAGG